jgi:hypothetical protein
MAPFDLTSLIGPAASFLVPFLLGVLFGAVLEMSGFGDSRKLAGQFYLRELTVLKVMFSAIIVAAVLIGLGVSFGWVDMDRLWVNPTYLLPGIVGGFVMGVGFIIGGFCPGTSLVAAATLKLDGVFFVVGVALGVFLFGQTVEFFDGFWHGTALGRVTLPEAFGVSHGVVVLAVVVMALVMFRLAEMAEARFGRGEPAAALRFLPRARGAWAWGGALVAVAAITALEGAPGTDRLWARVATAKQPLLESRAVYVHPGEVAELTRDTAVYTRILDVRSEAHYNLFHLRGAERVTAARLEDPAFVDRLKAAPANTAIFVVSNDEPAATAAWRALAARGVQNLYIIAGGVNGWLEVYPPPECLAEPREGPREPGTLAFDFFRAVGDCCNTAFPEVARRQLPEDCDLAEQPAGSPAHSAAGDAALPSPRVTFERKVELQKKAQVTGGCG